MTRGILFEAPAWAKEHLKARKSVYFKAVKEAKKAQAAAAAREKQENVDAATTEKQENIKAEGDAATTIKEEEEQEKEDVFDGHHDSEEDDATTWYVDLGTSDFWPCYLRFMFIAAYKMIQSEWADEENVAVPRMLSRAADSVALVPLKPPKELVLKIILRVCPPSPASTPPSSQTKQMLNMMSGFGLGMSFRRSGDEHGSLHLEICDRDAEVISVLGAAGLGPLCDMCRDHHKFIEVLEAGRIFKVAALLNKLKPYFAYCAEDLAGTPYAGIYDNVDENKTMEEITETFSEIASLDCGVTGTIGV